MVLKALLNHSLGRGITERYVQMTTERRREPVQKVADKMKELCGDRAPAGENVEKRLKEGLEEKPLLYIKWVATSEGEGLEGVANTPVCGMGHCAIYRPRKRNR